MAKRIICTKYVPVHENNFPIINSSKQIKKKLPTCVMHNYQCSSMFLDFIKTLKRDTRGLFHKSTSCRFSTKASILGATVYYTNEIGIWGDSSQTTKLLEDITKFVSPYLKDNVPAIKAEPLPTVAKVRSSTQAYWNKGVLNTSLFLSDLPNKVVVLTNRGVTFISEQLQKQEKVKEEN